MVAGKKEIGTPWTPTITTMLSNANIDKLNVRDTTGHIFY